MSCIFCQIINREIKSKINYEDETVIVFPDINPATPFHVLIVPKKHVKDLRELEDFMIWSKILEVVKLLVIKEKLDNKGFRLVNNGGGAQGVDHLHFHLMGDIKKDKAL